MKLSEDELLDELRSYIHTTYSQHYTSEESDSIQFVEFLIRNNEALGFLRCNCVKYGLRYGKKGGYNRTDILKMLHYGILLLADHDRNRKANND